MIQWKIGCSGYHYAEWKGLFYPIDLPKKDWFQFYCRHFNCIELNVTFYKFPRVESLRQWHDRSPENFQFCVKAPRLITHFKKFKDAQRMLSDVYNATGLGLQDKLGPILFQFPSNFVFHDDNLERIISIVDKSFMNVIEFRHMSWWDKKVFKTFSENNITFCGMSHPELPDDVIRTSPTIYYRFHGVPHLYTSSYETEKLERVAANINKEEGVKDAFVFFNNTAEGAAIQNAKQFQEICELVH